MSSEQESTANFTAGTVSLLRRQIQKRFVADGSPPEQR